MGIRALEISAGIRHGGFNELTPVVVAAMAKDHKTAKFIIAKHEAEIREQKAMEGKRE